MQKGTIITVPPRVFYAEPTLYAHIVNRLYTFDAQKSELVYTYPSSLLFFSVVEDSVLYTIEHSKVGTELYAFSLSKSDFLWKNATEHIFVSYPVVKDDAVYINTSNGVASLYKQDGKLLWSYGDESIKVLSPLIINDTLYVLSLNTPALLKVIEKNSGKLLRCVSLPSLYYTDTLTLLSNGKFICIQLVSRFEVFSVQNDSILWKYETARKIDSPITLDEEMLYMSYYILSTDSRRLPDGTLRYQAFVYAFRLIDGSIVWQRELEGEEGVSHPTSPVVDQGILYVEASGSVYAFDVNDGTLLWRYQIEASLSRPLPVANVVYVGADDGYVYALHQKDGSLLWKTFITDAVKITAHTTFKPL